MEEREERVVCPIEAGALREVPVYVDHRRARNWAATIRNLNPRAPGGLDRIFWERGRGPFLYLVPQDVGPGTAVEFGADYYTGSGRPHRTRWYGVVLEVSPDRMVLERCPDAVTALQRAAALRGQEKRVAEAHRVQCTRCGSQEIILAVRWEEGGGLWSGDRYDCARLMASKHLSEDDRVWLAREFIRAFDRLEQLPLVASQGYTCLPCQTEGKTEER